jgi:hypothetical protein
MNELSDYENLRLQNIQRNQEFLKNIGISEVALPSDSDELKGRVRKYNKSKRRYEYMADDDADYEPENTPTEPLRRSSRLDPTAIAARESLPLTPRISEIMTTDAIRPDFLAAVMALGHSEVRARKGLFNTAAADPDVPVDVKAAVAAAEAWIAEHAFDRSVDNKYLTGVASRARGTPVAFDLSEEAEGAEKSPVSAAGLAAFVGRTSETHSRSISNELLALTAHRVQTMSVRALTTRLKMIAT